MIDNGKRCCDRCGTRLHRYNNKCGYELCDKCNEQLEKSVANKKGQKNETDN